MDEDMLNDLKQLIAATVSRATADLATKEDLGKMGATLGARIDGLELKVDTISEALHEQLGDHESRLTVLERQPATS